MNASHGNKDADDFILDLIRNPRFPGAVNDIAVECGNSLHQPVLDRYVAGEDVPLVDVEPVWRDTLEPECGFSTLNERLIPLVRRLNQRLSPAQRLRVLACDSPVDWAQVRSREDLMALPETGDTIASVLENEVLSKGRKALLLFGIHHVMHGDSTAIGRLEARGYQGAALVIAEHIGFGNRASLPEDNQSLEARMASWPVPSLVSLEGTWLAELDSAYFNEPAGQRGYPGVDAYLYLGPRDLLLREPRSAQAVLDVDYIEALRQRATSIGAPPEGSMHPETIFGREEGATAFVYEPAP